MLFSYEEHVKKRIKMDIYHRLEFIHLTEKVLKRVPWAPSPDDPFKTFSAVEIFWMNETLHRYPYFNFKEGTVT